MDASKINQKHKFADLHWNVPKFADRSYFAKTFLYSGFLNISEFKLSIIVPNELFPLIAITLESIVCSEHDF